MYPAELVKPMKEDLTQVGFKELTTSEAVDQTIQNNQETLLVVVNSVCGCAAGGGDLPDQAGDAVHSRGGGGGGDCRGW